MWLYRRNLLLGGALVTAHPLNALAMTVAGQPVQFSLPTGATVDIPSTLLSSAPPIYPAVFREDFDAGLGHWGSSGEQREVVNGVFRSYSWSPDMNHLQAFGGVGLCHQIAYAHYPYWSYQKTDGAWVNSNFTNARLRARIRGVNFDPKLAQMYAWCQCRIPGPVQKFINYALVAEPFTDLLTSGAWHTLDLTLPPDQSKWAWAKGQAPNYDAYIPVEEALRYIHNFHFMAIQPDRPHEGAAPTGTFEMDWFEVIYNRNGPGLDAPEPEPGVLTNIIPLMTGPTTGGVTITGNSHYAAWEIAKFATLNSSTFQQWNGASGYIEVSLEGPVVPKKYAITSRPGDAQHAPRSWTIEGWNGSQWVVLDTQSNVPGWSGGERREINLTNNAAFDKVRFSVTASQSGSYLQWVRPELWA